MANSNSSASSSTASFNMIMPATLFEDKTLQKALFKEWDGTLLNELLKKQILKCENEQEEYQKFLSTICFITLSTPSVPDTESGQDADSYVKPTSKKTFRVKHVSGTLAVSKDAINEYEVGCTVWNKDGNKTARDSAVFRSGLRLNNNDSNVSISKNRRFCLKEKKEKNLWKFLDTDGQETGAFYGQVEISQDCLPESCRSNKDDKNKDDKYGDYACFKFREVEGTEGKKDPEFPEIKKTEAEKGSFEGYGEFQCELLYKKNPREKAFKQEDCTFFFENNVVDFSRVIYKSKFYDKDRRPCVINYIAPFNFNGEYFGRVRFGLSKEPSEENLKLFLSSLYRLVAGLYEIEQARKQFLHINLYNSRFVCRDQERAQLCRKIADMEFFPNDTRNASRPTKAYLAFVEHFLTEPRLDKYLNKICYIELFLPESRLFGPSGQVETTDQQSYFLTLARKREQAQDGNFIKLSQCENFIGELEKEKLGYMPFGELIPTKGLENRVDNCHRDGKHSETLLEDVLSLEQAATLFSSSLYEEKSRFDEIRECRQYFEKETERFFSTAEFFKGCYEFCRSLLSQEELSRILKSLVESQSNNDNSLCKLEETISAPADGIWEIIDEVQNALKVEKANDWTTSIQTIEKARLLIGKALSRLHSTIVSGEEINARIKLRIKKILGMIPGRFELVLIMLKTLERIQSNFDETEKILGKSEESTEGATKKGEVYSSNEGLFERIRTLVDKLVDCWNSDSIKILLEDRNKEDNEPGVFRDLKSLFKDLKNLRSFLASSCLASSQLYKLVSGVDNEASDELSLQIDRFRDVQTNLLMIVTNPEKYLFAQNICENFKKFLKESEEYQQYAENIFSDANGICKQNFLYAFEVFVIKEYKSQSLAEQGKKKVKSKCVLSSQNLSSFVTFLGEYLENLKVSDRKNALRTFWELLDVDKFKKLTSDSRRSEETIRQIKEYFEQFKKQSNFNSRNFNSFMKEYGSDEKFLDGLSTSLKKWQKEKSVLKESQDYEQFLLKNFSVLWGEKAEVYTNEEKVAFVKKVFSSFEDYLESGEDSILSALRQKGENSTSVFSTPGGYVSPPHFLSPFENLFYRIKNLEDIPFAPFPAQRGQYPDETRSFDYINEAFPGYGNCPNKDVQKYEICPCTTELNGRRFYVAIFKDEYAGCARDVDKQTAKLSRPFDKRKIPSKIMEGHKDSRHIRSRIWERWAALRHAKIVDRTGNLCCVDVLIPMRFEQRTFWVSVGLSSVSKEYKKYVDDQDQGKETSILVNPTYFDDLVESIFRDVHLLRLAQTERLAHIHEAQQKASHYLYLKFSDAHEKGKIFAQIGQLLGSVQRSFYEAFVCLGDRQIDDEERRKIREGDQWRNMAASVSESYRKKIKISNCPSQFEGAYSKCRDHIKSLENIQVVKSITNSFLCGTKPVLMTPGIVFGARREWNVDRKLDLKAMLICEMEKASIRTTYGSNFENQSLFIEPWAKQQGKKRIIRPYDDFYRYFFTDLLRNVKKNTSETSEMMVDVVPVDKDFQKPKEMGTLCNMALVFKNRTDNALMKESGILSRWLTINKYLNEIADPHFGGLAERAYILNVTKTGALRIRIEKEPESQDYYFGVALAFNGLIAVPIKSCEDSKQL